MKVTFLLFQYKLIKDASMEISFQHLSCFFAGVNSSLITALSWSGFQELLNQTKLIPSSIKTKDECPFLGHGYV